jgi:hypothetical protein
MLRTIGIKSIAAMCDGNPSNGRGLLRPAMRPDVMVPDYVMRAYPNFILNLKSDGTAPCARRLEFLWGCGGLVRNRCKVSDSAVHHSDIRHVIRHVERYAKKLSLSY